MGRVGRWERPQGRLDDAWPRTIVASGVSQTVQRRVARGIDHLSHRVAPYPPAPRTPAQRHGGRPAELRQDRSMSATRWVTSCWAGRSGMGVSSIGAERPATSSVSFAISWTEVPTPLPTLNTGTSAAGSVSAGSPARPPPPPRHRRRGRSRGRGAGPPAVSAPRQWRRARGDRPASVPVSAAVHAERSQHDRGNAGGRAVRPRDRLRTQLGGAVGRPRLRGRALGDGVCTGLAVHLRRRDVDEPAGIGRPAGLDHGRSSRYMRADIQRRR